MPATLITFNLEAHNVYIRPACHRGRLGSRPFSVAIADADQLTIDHLVNFRASDFPSGEEALSSYMKPLGSAPPRRASLAVAGYLDGDRAHLHGRTRTFTTREMKSALSFEEHTISSDAVALARTAQVLSEHDLHHVCEAQSDVGPRLALAIGNSVRSAVACFDGTLESWPAICLLVRQTTTICGLSKQYVLRWAEARPEPFSQPMRCSPSQPRVPGTGRQGHVYDGLRGSCRSHDATVFVGRHRPCPLSSLAFPLYGGRVTRDRGARQCLPRKGTTNEASPPSQSPSIPVTFRLVRRSTLFYNDTCLCRGQHKRRLERGRYGMPLKDSDAC